MSYFSRNNFEKETKKNRRFYVSVFVVIAISSLTMPFFL